MKPLSTEIKTWYFDHGFILNNDSWHPIEFVWNGSGTIDRLKTARTYIQSKSHDLSLRFQMACVYGLEEEIRQLWGEMAGTTRRDFSAIRLHDYSCWWERVVKDWTTLLISGVVDRRQLSFSYPISWDCPDRLIIQGNILQYLHPKHQMYVLRNEMKENFPTRSKSFCLLQKNTSQFEDVFKTEPLQVYKAFLKWLFH
ncbi:uncharacterized protein NPIL_306971 [Nephila pilipes]|uniref:Uncharacterized protein n=1 Tax=Nephila pilipes TaxID=299642 RepID=A0A8X6QTS7_NEPPI|nr:uncharacterized protein NPIL_306971 [Nephila pilipes]